MMMNSNCKKSFVSFYIFITAQCFVDLQAVCFTTPGELLTSSWSFAIQKTPLVLDQATEKKLTFKRRTVHPMSVELRFLQKNQNVFLIKRWYRIKTE